MKIVVLDGYAINPGDLSWDVLKSFGTCTLHDRSPPDTVVQRVGDAEIVLTNRTPLNRETIRKLAKLKYIGVLATDAHHVNVEAARKRGVLVTNVPEYSTQSVAQMVFALLLEHTQHVDHHAFTVRKGRWSRNADYCYWVHPLVELSGLTMGIVGLGKTAQAVSSLALAFGMNVLVHTGTHTSSTVPNIRFTDLDTLFRESDVVSLHCPLTPETQGLVSASRLALMKPKAVLINTGNGALIDETALADVLNRGRIAGAALDALSEEPPPLNHPLVKAKNCLITPHIAGATRAARQRLIECAADNVKAFLAGSPKNLVHEASAPSF